MNLKHLEVFKAVMTTGSTIAAGPVLQMSQSAISRQLGALEAEIGFPLFQRDRGRLIATPEAHALLPEALEVIERLSKLRRKTEELRTGGGNSYVKAAFPHSMTTTVLPRIVSAFLAERPGASIEVLTGPYGVTEQLVADRVADLGFVMLPPEDKTLQAVPILTSPIVCVMPAGHPLAGGEVVHMRDLAACDLILLGRKRQNRRGLDAQLRAVRPHLRPRIETHSVESACALAAEGLGVALVPALIGDLFRHLPIAIRPCLPQTSNLYGIVTPQGAPLSLAAAAFIEVARAILVGLGDAVEDSEPPTPERESSRPKGPASHL